MMKYRHVQFVNGSDSRINLYVSQPSDQMATHASKKLINGYCVYVQRLIVGAPYDKQIEFRTVRDSAGRKQVEA